MRIAAFISVGLAIASFAKPAFADGDAVKGKALFSRCGVCHTVTDQDKVGPHLLNVFGRKAGTVSTYHYSAAMTNSGLVWDTETLDAFLSGPSAKVPGTKMGIGAPNAQDRADIIAYLKTLTSP